MRGVYLNPDIFIPIFFTSFLTTIIIFIIFTILLKHRENFFTMTTACIFFGISLFALNYLQAKMPSSYIYKIRLKDKKYARIDTRYRRTKNTQKYFKKNDHIVLEAANQNYEPIKLDLNDVSIQGKLLAVWRKL